MDGRIFFEAVHAGEIEANETLRSFCRAVAVQIYNLNVLLDLEKVAIGGGISKQPILVETLNEVYEEYILRGHPFSEAQARCPAPPGDRALPVPERGQPDRCLCKLPEGVFGKLMDKTHEAVLYWA